MPGEEDLIQAIKWKLGLSLQPEEKTRARQVWAEEIRKDPRRADQICINLAELVRQVLLCEIRGPTPLSQEAEALNKLWTRFKNWLATQEGGRDLLPLSGVIKGALSRSTIKGLVGRPAARGNATRPVSSNTGAPLDLRPAAKAVDQLFDQAAGTPPQPAAQGTARPPAVKSPMPTSGKAQFAEAIVSRPPLAKPRTVDAGEDPTLIFRREAQLSDTVPQWKDIPVPDEPDKHDANDSAPVVESANGLKLFGARVRGKKHKHEGTNCDDWFEVAVEGPWTIIAVSDGAGSKKFSRVGAHVSCKAAVASLRERLRSHRLEPFAALQEGQRNKSSGVFSRTDLEYVQQAVHEAMVKALEEVQRAAAERTGMEYTQLLGRPLNVQDLSATLLLAVHTPIQYQNGERSFILTCQVGDGMIAAIDRDSGLQLLAEPDSGEFSGETEFLTSARKVEKENLVRKTFASLLPLHALFVMTDGVADDYFPNNPGVLRLHADLVLNRILDVGRPGQGEISAALQATALRDMTGVASADFHMADAAPGMDPRQGGLASAVQYAEKLGLPLEQVQTSPALLAAGSSVARLSMEIPAEQRLLKWLDSYYVRGSFDDRTLVILYRESLP